MICSFCGYEHDNQGDIFGCPNCCGELPDLTPGNILFARQKAGLTMKALADLMQVSRMTVHNWENGIHPMKARDWEYLQIKLNGVK